MAIVCKNNWHGINEYKPAAQHSFTNVKKNDEISTFIMQCQYNYK